MTKFLLIGNYPPPYGGVPHHLQTLSQYLSDKGHEVFIVSGGTLKSRPIKNVSVIKANFFEKIVSFLVGFSRDILAGDIDFRMLIHEPRHWIRHKIFYQQALKVLKRHEISLVSSYNLLAYSPIGEKISSQFNIPHVVNIFGEIYKDKSLTTGLQQRARKILDNASSIISCSEHCGKSISKITESSTCNFVTYGIDIDHFTPDHVDRWVDRPSSLPINILYLARQSEEMGLDKFLFIARHLLSLSKYDINFTIGGSRGNLTQDALSLQNEFPDRVKVITDVKYDELPSVYRSADICVICPEGDRTCSSMGLMESYSCGIPVLAVDCGGIPEIMSEEIGFMTGNTIEDLLSALKTIIESPCQIKKKIDEIKKSEIEFCYKKTCHEVLSIFLNSTAQSN